MAGARFTSCNGVFAGRFPGAAGEGSVGLRPADLAGFWVDPRNRAVRDPDVTFTGRPSLRIEPVGPVPEFETGDLEALSIAEQVVADIEEREKAGTPGVLQILKAGLAFAVKDRIGVAAIEAREHELLQMTLARWRGNPNVELLGNPDVDAVYVATPHYLHAPLSIRALEAGKHVYTEKPMAVTREEGQRLLVQFLEFDGALLESIAEIEVPDAKIKVFNELTAALAWIGE